MNSLTSNHLSLLSHPGPEIEKNLFLSSACVAWQDKSSEMALACCTGLNSTWLMFWQKQYVDLTDYPQPHS